MADPAGRFNVAFDQLSLLWDVEWTALDQEHPSLVVSYTIERGRAYELDRVDVGRAVVTINDPDGLLDPTNGSSPYATGLGLQPMLQAALARRNPRNGVWYTRFRGFIESFEYLVDPPVNRATISLVDLFEVVSAVELHPGMGDTPPTESKGQVFYLNTDDKEPDFPDHRGMQVRVVQVLGDCNITDDYHVVFSGNVSLKNTVYSPGESAMTAIQEAVDSEFPAVGNAYVDRLRLGRLAVHGRYARFDPVATAATVSDAVWDFQQWQAGDGAAVNSDPTNIAHLRGFAFDRGLEKIINKAFAVPVDVSDTAAENQTVEDAGSIAQYGTRGWSAQYLLTKEGFNNDDTTNTALQETKLFAQYMVDNYKEPANRITQISFRTIHPDAVGAAPTWHLLCRCDIADTVAITVDHPGGGGFDAVDHFIEGVHEEATPLNPDYDNVTLTLDLSPAVYYQENPWP